MQLAETALERENEIPPSERTSEWYQNVFEKRLAGLLPYDDPSEARQQFATDKANLCPVKLTAAIIHKFSDDRFEILISANESSGYHWGDHNKITREYGFGDWNIYKDSCGILFTTSDDKRYLLINGLDHLLFLKVREASQYEAFEATLQRYNINTVFSVNNEGFDNYQLNPDPERLIVVGNHLEQWENLVNDDWKAGIAQKFGWDNLEWLRFRMVGEFPQWKMPSYKK